MQISLSDHFTYQKLLRFVAPSILMMIITSIYSIVDGFFVSNFVGKNSFAALNLIFPVIMALAAVGFMIGTGGSALIAKTLGEGKPRKANEIFSMLVIVLAARRRDFKRRVHRFPAPHLVRRRRDGPDDR